MKRVYPPMSPIRSSARSVFTAAILGRAAKQPFDSGVDVHSGGARCDDEPRRPRRPPDGQPNVDDDCVRFLLEQRSGGLALPFVSMRVLKDEHELAAVVLHRRIQARGSSVQLHDACVGALGRKGLAETALPGVDRD